MLNKNWPFKNMCEDLGDLLYCLYTKEEKRNGCGNLMLDWIKSRFWGRVIEDHIPIFNEAFNLLKRYEHDSYKNGIEFGDWDSTTWYEEVEGDDFQFTQVILSKSHCSCNGDDTHIYIRSGCIPIPECNKFLCRTAWDKQKKNRFSFGDHRDIELPSVHTYRRHNFNFGYGDARDKGHVFSYKGSIGGVDNPGWHETKIPTGLQILKYHLVNLKERYE